MTDHGLAVHGLRQGHLNQYLSDGPSTRYAIRTFTGWSRTKRSAGLEIPHRYAATKPLITQQQRLDLIRHCIESTTSPLGFRVAALILLLFGQPVGKDCSDEMLGPEGTARRAAPGPGQRPRPGSCADCPYVLGLSARPDQPADRQRREPMALPRHLAGPAHPRRRDDGPTTRLGHPPRRRKEHRLTQSRRGTAPNLWSQTHSATATRSSTNTPPMLAPRLCRHAGVSFVASKKSGGPGWESQSTAWGGSPVRTPGF
jgi:hypothetical protein